MSYRETAKKLSVHYLFWRYSISFHRYHDDAWWPRLIRLDGWIFDISEIKQAIADDPAFAIKFKGGE